MVQAPGARAPWCAGSRTACPSSPCAGPGCRSCRCCWDSTPIRSRATRRAPASPSTTRCAAPVDGPLERGILRASKLRRRQRPGAAVDVRGQPGQGARSAFRGGRLAARVLAQPRLRPLGRSRGDAGGDPRRSGRARVSRPRCSAITPTASTDRGGRPQAHRARGASLVRARAPPRQRRAGHRRRHRPRKPPCRRRRRRCSGWKGDAAPPPAAAPALSPAARATGPTAARRLLYTNDPRRQSSTLRFGCVAAARARAARQDRPPDARGHDQGELYTRLRLGKGVTYGYDVDAESFRGGTAIIRGHVDVDGKATPGRDRGAARLVRRRAAHRRSPPNASSSSAGTRPAAAA